jgi:15-cis-phytoene desaturase
VGSVGAQLTLDLITPGTSFVRLLNGPTSDKWIDPWMSYLRQMGVDYRLDSKVESIECVDGSIKSVTITEGEQQYKVEGDYYISAFPVEVMEKFITSPMLKADPDLAGIKLLANSVDWMKSKPRFGSS